MLNKNWNDEILKAIAQSGGQNVALQKIYSEMKNSPLVTSRHLEPWVSRGQQRYECWIRRCLTTLIRRNIIKRVSRGAYSLRSN